MSLQRGSKIHFMGIGGTAMGNLAGLFHKKGFEVTGSDLKIYPPMSTQLEKLKIPIYEGYEASNLDHKPDLVVVGNVISKHFKEAEALLAKDLPYTHLPKAIADHIIEDRHSIVVTGTHGKTTTTSWMAWASHICDLKPGFLIGGVPKDFPESFCWPEGDYFIIEGDEYDTAFFDKTPKFIHYKPRSVIITSLEFDHADIYNNLDEIKQAFKQLVSLIPKDGLLIYNGDDKNVCEVVAKARCPKFSYGFQDGADYQVTQTQVISTQVSTAVIQKQSYSVQWNNQPLVDLQVQLFGEHNIANSLAVLALGHQLKWNFPQLQKGIESFTGVKRRQELIGTPKNIQVIEDFAHHPTAVRLTLESMRSRYPDQNIFCIFEPRSTTSRRKVFQKEYAAAFGSANTTLIAEPYGQEQIPEADRFSSEQLVKDLTAQGQQAHYFKTHDEIIKFLSEQAAPKDIILMMSNGGFGGIYPRLLKALEQ